MPRMVVPDHIGERDWFDSLRMTFPHLVIPILTRESDWKTIAAYVKNYSGFKGRVPDAKGFDDWRTWARAFYNAVGG